MLILAIDTQGSHRYTDITLPVRHRGGRCGVLPSACREAGRRIGSLPCVWGHVCCTAPLTTNAEEKR
jgi:hypothetical protein